MPADKIDIDVSRVRRMVATQFPHWADLPIGRVEPGGWDNYTFHLGDNMMVRMPSAERYAAQVDKEHQWLPRLAPLLPLPIPVPLAMGQPADGYPWNWSIYQWLDGESANVATIADLSHFASDLAQFLAALQQIDPSDGPPPGPHNFYRGGPLATYDMETRDAIGALNGRIDTNGATDVWEAALQATWQTPPVWLHGDVSAGNLLVRAGKLCAVIDFGSSSVGDPACDLTIAWTFFSGASREAFRAAVPGDSAAWARARGWALWKGLITLAGHVDSNSFEARTSRHVIEEVLADHIRNF